MHTTALFRSRRIRVCKDFLRVWASYRFHFSALASATSNGIGERLHQQRILGSGGCHFVIRYVVADNLRVVCFQKSSCCLSCCMFVPVMLCDAAVPVPALSTPHIQHACINASFMCMPMINPACIILGCAGVLTPFVCRGHDQLHSASGGDRQSCRVDAGLQ